VDDATLRAMMLDTLNERSDPGRHFITQTIDHAIRLAKATVFTFTGDGSQESLTATTDGTSRIPITDDILRVIRVDNYDGCGLTKYTVENANQLNSGWRGCDYIEGENPTGYVLDPESPTALWIVQAPPAGVEVNFTAVTAQSDSTPEHLLPIVRHYALSYAYEKAYGNNHNAEIHRSRALDHLRIYSGVISNG